MSAIHVTADDVLAAVAAGEVEHHRRIAGPAAPDFYRYDFTVFGRFATLAQRRWITTLAERGEIRCGSFAGCMGPASETVTLAG